MTNILNIDALKACALFQSKETTRYYLNGVCYKHKDGASIYTATHGHACIHITIKGEKQSNIDEFIIPSIVMKSLPKKTTRLPVVFSPTDITFDDEHGPKTYKRVDGTFPDVDRVFPSETEEQMPYVKLNAEYLLAAQKAMEIMKVPGFRGVCLHPNYMNGPHYVTQESDARTMNFTNFDKEDVTVKIVIMPVRA